MILGEREKESEMHERSGKYMIPWGGGGREGKV